MNRFTFTSMSDEVDPVLDAMLRISIKSGILSLVLPNPFYIKIWFKNGDVMRAWNDNKYYAWLTEGEIIIKDTNYKWSDARPSKSTMAALYNALK